MIEEYQDVQESEAVEQAAAPFVAPVLASHFAIWQAAEQWSQKLEDSLKAEFAQFVEQYKNLI